jgi:hypothetical protein
MTKASVKPALKRIEDKLDSIDQRLCNVDPNYSSKQMEKSEFKEAFQEESSE